MANEGDYEVGYGKPPEKNQFTKGKSGNPKGRPKKSKNLKTILNQHLGEEISIMEGATRKTITAQEALVKATLHQALKGDRTGQFKFFDLILKVNGGPEGEEEVKAHTYSSDEQAVIERYNQRLLTSMQITKEKE